MTARATRPTLAAFVGLLAWVSVTPAVQASPRSVESARVLTLGEATAEVGTFAVAGFSLVVPFGVAEAGIDGTGARAASVFIDWTVPASLFGAARMPTLEGAGAPTQLPPFPSPIRVDSASQDEGDHHGARPAQLPIVGPTGSDQQGVVIGGGYEQAHIGDGPSSWARTEVGMFSLPVTAAAGGSSESHAAPDAVASESVLGELRLGPPGSEVVLSGLHWTASQTLGARATASFGIGAIEVGGVRHVAPAPEELSAIFEAANALLAPTGVTITAPVAEASDTGSMVTPLVIRYGKSALAAATADPAYALLAPLLLPFVDSAQQGAPEIGTAFYVFTVMQAALTGHGDLTLELGGASAHIGKLTLAKLGDGPAPAALATIADPSAAPSSPGGPAVLPAAALPELEVAPSTRAVEAGLRTVVPRERVLASLVVATTLFGLLGAAMVMWAEHARRRQACLAT